MNLQACYFVFTLVATMALFPSLAPSMDDAAPQPSSSVGYIGASLQTVNSGITEQRNGVKVLSVADGSPAATFGLRPDDIIQQVNGTDVSTADDFLATIRSSKIGSYLYLQVSSNGFIRHFRIEVAERPDQIPIPTNIRRPYDPPTVPACQAKYPWANPTSLFQREECYRDSQSDRDLVDTYEELKRVGLFDAGPAYIRRAGLWAAESYERMGDQPNALQAIREAASIVPPLDNTTPGGALGVTEEAGFSQELVAAFHRIDSADIASAEKFQKQQSEIENEQKLAQRAKAEAQSRATPEPDPGLEAIKEMQAEDAREAKITADDIARRMAAMNEGAEQNAQRQQALAEHNAAVQRANNARFIAKLNGDFKTVAQREGKPPCNVSRLTTGGVNVILWEYGCQSYKPTYYRFVNGALDLTYEP